MSDLLQFILGQQSRFRRARLPSLFSDFTSQRYTNPDGYFANVNIWKDALCDAARAGLISENDSNPQRFSLAVGPQLLQRLESREWGRPLALDAVINEAISQGDLIPYQSFLSSPNSIYCRQWIDLPWRLISWGLKHIGLQYKGLVIQTRTSKRFILIPNVERAAAKVMQDLQNQSSQIDRVFAKPGFGKDAARALGITDELSNSDLTILLTYLARDRPSLVYDGAVVKLASPGEVLSPVSKEDRAIASLKTLMDDINEQIHSLEKQISALREKSQSALEKKNRSLALAVLRSKKSAESALSKRLQTLSQLEEVYGTIEQASDQITMLQVMKGSAAVLRSLNAKAGSSQDVEDVLDGLKEAMGNTEEIGTAINEAEQESNAVSEDDVNEELEALVRQSQSAEEEKGAEETKRRLAEVHVAGADDANHATHSTPTTYKTAADQTAGSDSPAREANDAPKSLPSANTLAISIESLHSQGREKEDIARLAT